MKVKEIMLWKPKLRRAYLEKRFYKFSKRYFSQYFDFKTPEYAKQYYKALQEWKNIYFEWFRWSMKTTIFQWYITYAIAYRKRRNIMWYSQNKENSTKNLTYIANSMIWWDENRKFVRDNWELYYWDDVYKWQKRQKSTARFVTENECQVLAMSLGTSPRWENFTATDWKFRPDLVGFDDVDTIDSCASQKKIDKRWEFILNEIFWWLNQHTQIVFLGNTIYDDWVVRRMEEHIKDDKRWVIIKQPIYDENWNIVRPERYVETDAEAEEINSKLNDNRLKVISLETERRQLGSISFAQNYLLIPYVKGTRIITMEHIQYEDCSGYEFDSVQCWVDPAISQKDWSDSFAFTVVWFDRDKRYILECVALEWKDKWYKNVIKTAQYLFKKWNITQFKIEAVQFQAVLKQMFDDVRLPAIAITPHKDKVTRLIQHQADFENGLIYFNTKWTQDLITELLDFPNWEHDDMVDSMVYGLLPADWREIFV